MKSFKKIFSKTLVLGSIVALSFMLTGCQQTQIQQTGDVQKQEIQPKKGLFFFGNDKVKDEKKGKIGIEPSNIDRYVKIELESQMPVKVYGGTFPIVVKTENYVYIKPNNLNTKFNAGTSLSENGLTITYSVGGSSDVEFSSSNNNQITVPLAQFIDGKVIPMYYSTTLGTVNVDVNSNIATLLEKKLVFYLCYPVLKKDEFSLEVPGSNRGNGAEAYKNIDVELKPNRGEITYTINAQGSPKGDNEYQYILTIQAKKTSEDNLKLTSEGMEKCGPVPSTSTGKYPVSYFYIKPISNNQVSIKCNNKEVNGFEPLVFYNGDESSPLVCTITLPRETADKEFSFEIYSEYTLVKTIESKFQVIKNQ